MRATILLIDEDAPTREILRTVLEGAGFQVIETGDATDGVRLADRCQPAAVVTEYMIPFGGGGRCVVEELRGGPLTAEIPTVVFTTSDLVEVRERVRLAGAEFIAKPAAPGVVVECIRRLTRPPVPPARHAVRRWRPSRDVQYR